MVNIKVTFPSEVSGAVVDIQKGRAVTALNQDELDFLTNLNALLGMSNVKRGNDPEPAPVVITMPYRYTSDAAETAA